MDNWMTEKKGQMKGSGGVWERGSEYEWEETKE